jgi:hypothetical protein
MEGCAPKIRTFIQKTELKNYPFGQILLYRVVFSYDNTLSFKNSKPY